MALQPPAAPDAIRLSAIEEVRALEQASLPHGAALAREVGGRDVPMASDPLPIYSLSLAVIARDADPLPRAEHHGWRVMVGSGGDRRVVDLKGTGADATPSMTRGRLSAELLERAGALAERDAPSGTNFEVRLLNIPRLATNALWLRASGHADRFYTIEAEPIKRTAAELFDGLRVKAARRLTEYNVVQQASSSPGGDESGG